MKPKNPRKVLCGVIKAWTFEAALLLWHREPADALVEMIADVAELAFYSDPVPVRATELGGGSA